ncbi:MAG: hypothetical protein JWM87_1534 [Candidatus Eremiobacteraeota bacterium]|nr:hypothetical protein [Candidatus Eremiobacteraeota bacterium]
MPDTTPIASAEVVAKYILAQSPLHRMSAMKLQKLVFYSQAWSLAWDDRVLFGEPIEASSEGPIVRSLWEKTNRAYEVSLDDLTGDLATLDSGAQKTILNALRFYGDMTDGELGDLIEVEEPWRAARGESPSDAVVLHATIDIGLMTNYYRALGRRADVAV